MAFTEKFEHFMEKSGLPEEDRKKYRKMSKSKQKALMKLHKATQKKAKYSPGQDVEVMTSGVWVAGKIMHVNFPQKYFEVDLETDEEKIISFYDANNIMREKQEKYDMSIRASVSGLSFIFSLNFASKMLGPKLLYHTEAGQYLVKNNPLLLAFFSNIFIILIIIQAALHMAYIKNRNWPENPPHHRKLLSIFCHFTLSQYLSLPTLPCHIIHGIMFSWHLVKALDGVFLRSVSPFHSLKFVNCIECLSYVVSSFMLGFSKIAVGISGIAVYASLRWTKYV